jgi:hypothetical protein
MRIRLTSLGLLAAAAVLPAPASAQVLVRPTRAADMIARTDPGSSSQSLVAAMSLFGGYDTNDASGVNTSDPNAPPLFLDSSSSVLTHGSLDYARNSGGQFIGVNLAGAGNFYGGSNSELGPATIVGTGLTFETPMGQASRFSADQRVDYNSLYTVGAFNDLAEGSPVGEIPTDSSVQGVSELSTLLSTTNVGVTRQLGRRSDLSLQYGYVHNDNLGTGDGDANSHRATVGFSRQLQRRSSMIVSYSYSNGEFAPLSGIGNSRPLVGHTIQSGFDFTKRLSPRRAVQFSFTLGASRNSAVTGDVDLIEYSFWTPAANASARVDLGRTWTLTGNYGRAVTPLAGLTGETYVADTVGYALGGDIGRVGIALTGGAAIGSQGAGALQTSDYTSYTQSAQANVPITDRLEVVAQYNWYRHDVTGTAEVASAVPTRFSRSSVRVGLTWELPIISTR